jgi:hypothetical protein
MSPARFGCLASRLQVMLLLAAIPLAAADGSLRVKADVSGAEVYLDGRSVGATPLTLQALPAGTHKLVLVKPGYEDYAQDVEVQPGQMAKVFVIMKPLPKPLPILPVKFYAIHQHRAGACSGILTVTAEAVEYRSHDGKDVFHIPLEQIRSVSRSMGATAGVGPAMSWGVPAEYAGCRIEAPGRSYGFFAYEEDPKLEGTPAESRVTLQQTGAKTKELFELVYRLWSDFQNSKRQAGPAPQ